MHPSSLPLEGFAVLNDTPVACQTSGPTDPQGDRCSHIPAASAATYPLRCSAPHWARFDNRQKRPAHQPLPSLLSAAAAQEVQAIPRTDNDPRRTNSAKPAPPNSHLPAPRQGSLDRRSKRLSFPHFFLRRKKCGRRRPPPRQGKANSPPQRAISRPGASGFFVSDGDSFAPRRERFLCLRRPHFFQQRKKWGKERRQKLRFCTSSARYTRL